MIQSPQSYYPVQQQQVAQQRPGEQSQCNAVNIQIIEPKAYAQPDPVYNYPQAPIYEYPQAPQSN